MPGACGLGLAGQGVLHHRWAGQRVRPGMHLLSGTAGSAWPRWVRTRWASFHFVTNRRPSIQLGDNVPSLSKLRSAGAPFKLVAAVGKDLN